MAANKRCLTPPVHCAGVFSLIAPFKASGTTTYTVDAIETFRELKADRVDIFARYYQRMGLSTNEYTIDDALNASIVTLRAGDGSLIEVPDTYIASYPGDSGVEHVRIVMVADLGLIPTYMDVEYLTSDIKDVLRKNIGVIGEVTMAQAPVTTQLTYQQHISSERQRKANVTAYESKDQVIARQQAEIDNLRKKNEQLEQLVLESQPR